MTAVTVVGVGSPHGADRYGWQVVDRLAEEIGPESPGSAGVRLVTSDRPGLALLDLIRDARTAIIVDAVAGGEQGRVVCLDKHQLLVECANLSTHAFGVAEALALGQVADVLPIDILLVGLETGEQPLAYTPPEEAIETAVAIIQKKVLHLRPRMTGRVGETAPL